MSHFTLSPSKLQFSYEKFSIREADIMNDLFDFVPSNSDSCEVKPQNANISISSIPQFTSESNSKKRSFMENPILGSDDECSTSMSDRKYDANSNKKRFMWSDSLHREFVLAVYGIGLKFVSIKAIRDFSNKNNFGDTSLSNEQILSFVNNQRKYHEYRTNKENSYNVTLSCKGTRGDLFNDANGFSSPNVMLIEKSLKDEHNSGLNTSFSAAEKSALDDRRICEKTRVEALHYLQDQHDQITKKINNQANYICSMQIHIERQQLLQTKLTEKISKLNKTSPINNSNSISSSELNTIETYCKMAQNNEETTINDPRNNKSSSSSSSSNNNNATRSNMSIESLRIFNEMQQNMEIHKKLFLRREDLLNQHPNYNDATSSSSVKIHHGPATYNSNELKSSDPLRDRSVTNRLHDGSIAKHPPSVSTNSAFLVASPIRTRQDPVILGASDWPVDGFDALDENLFSFLLE